MRLCICIWVNEIRLNASQTGVSSSKMKKFQCNRLAISGWLVSLKDGAVLRAKHQLLFLAGWSFVEAVARLALWLGVCTEVASDRSDLRSTGCHSVYLGLVAVVFWWLLILHAHFHRSIHMTLPQTSLTLIFQALSFPGLWPTQPSYSWNIFKCLTNFPRNLEAIGFTNMTYPIDCTAHSVQ